ncbi:MAG: DUF3179 domain-containing (seleno)protein [Planctomycetota bacterium]
MSDDSAPAGAPDPDPPRPVRLDFKSGGWVLLLSMALVMTLVVWRLYVIRDARSWRDNVAPPPTRSNGFDLSTATVPVKLIGNQRQPDGMQSLVDPPIVTQEQLTQLNESKWTKYLVPEDKVIGVSLGGESRAYPTRVLTWHEVANDTLGGVPIAVTYCPHSGSAAVYDRRLPGRVIELRMSGLIYNANNVLYDLQGNRSVESLWSQVQGRAIAGPEAASGTELTALPCQLMYWRDWIIDHPESTVMGGDLRHKKLYRSDPYLNYPRSPGVKYPHEPMLPDSEAAQAKELMLMVTIGDTTAVFGSNEIAEHVDLGGSWTTQVGAVPVVIYQKGDAGLGVCNWIHSLDPSRPIQSARSMYRFAWRANFSAPAPSSGSDQR